MAEDASTPSPLHTQSSILQMVQSICNPETHQQKHQTTSLQVPGQVFSQQTYPQQRQQEQCQPESAQPHSMYKNRLQEFTQKANIKFPVYRTRNEAELRHAPQFKCTVEVDGETYTTLNTFANRKAAEQDAAKLALEGISKKIKTCVSNKTKDEGFPPIYEDRFFCKSILHEYAAKLNMEKPTYNTARLEGLLPVFVSSLVFGGTKFTGQPSVNKKEAEQLAARAVILSILADSGPGSPLYEIVKSKAKYFSAVHERCSADTGVSHLPNSGSVNGMSATKKRVYEDSELADITTETGNTIENVASRTSPKSGLVLVQPASKVVTSNHATEASKVTGNAVLEGVQVQCPLLQRHQLVEQNWATFPQPSLQPLQATEEPSLQPLQAKTSLDGVDCGEKKKSKKKKKKKANKNMQAIQ